MASYKANWIVGLVSVLLDCVLTGAEPILGRADMKLISRLDDANSPLKPEQLKEILQKHENQDFEIDSIPVKTFVESCTPSLEKCTRKGFETLHSLGEYYGQGRVLYDSRREYHIKNIDKKLREYSIYCSEELQKFCAENYDDVKKSFLEGLNDEEKELARSFMNILHKIWPHNRMPEDKYIVRAYKQLRESKPKVESDRMKFRSQFKEVFYKFQGIYLDSFSLIGNVPSEYVPAQRKRKLSTLFQAFSSKPRTDIGQLSPDSSSPDDILMTQWWKTCAAGHKITSLPGSRFKLGI